MKKVSLAAFLASALMLNTPVAQADSTVKGQKAASPATAAAAAAPAASTSGGHHSPSAELIARPGNHRTIFELDFMVPVYQMMDRMLFVDLRGQLDTRRNKELNFGLGYRQIIHNSFVLGGYVYGDWRRTRNSNNFWQVTLGAEALSIANLIDVRVNGYLPEKKRKFIRGTAGNTAQIVGNNIQISRAAEGAIPGFDGEVGVRIPMPGMNQVETRIFAGGYYFSRSGAPKVAGPRGRLEVRINDIINPGSRLTLGVDVMNDKVRKTNVFGFIGLRVPMQFMGGGKTPQGLQRRLADYVYRDVDVITSDKISINKSLLQNSAGQPVYVVTVNGAASTGGNGSIGSPLQTTDAGITAINTKAQDGSILYLQSSAAAIATANAVPFSTNNVNVWGDGVQQVVSEGGVTYLVTNVGGGTSTKVTGFATGATLDFSGGTAGGVNATAAGFTITVPDNANALGIKAAYTNTTGTRTLALSNLTVTPAGVTTASNGISVSAGGTGGTVNATYSNVTGTGFSNATSGAIINTVTGSGVMNVASNKLTLTGNQFAFVNTQSGNAPAASITVADTNSTYTNNGESAIVGTANTAGNIAGAGTIKGTFNNPTISSNKNNAVGIQFLNTDANGAATTLTGIVTGGSIANTGNSATGVLFSAADQTFTGSTAALTVTNVTIQGNNVATGGNGSFGILINRDGATQGTVTATLTGNKFSQNAGNVGEGADINFDDAATAVTTTATITGNTISSPTGLAITTGSLAFTKSNAANAPTSVTLNNNKFTGTGNNGNAIFMTNGVGQAYTAGTLTIDGTGGNNVITGYNEGIAVEDAGTTAGAISMNFIGTGNQITGNTLGLDRAKSAGAAIGRAVNMTFNGHAAANAAALYGNADVAAVIFGNPTGSNAQASNLVN